LAYSAVSTIVSNHSRNMAESESVSRPDW